MIAILSDIHGNRPALEAVFAEMAKLGVRRMVVLGDVIGYVRFPDDRAGHPYHGAPSRWRVAGEWAK